MSNIVLRGKSGRAHRAAMAGAGAVAVSLISAGVAAADPATPAEQAGAAVTNAGSTVTTLFLVGVPVVLGIALLPLILKVGVKVIRRVASAI